MSYQNEKGRYVKVIARLARLKPLERTLDALTHLGVEGQLVRVREGALLPPNLAPAPAQSVLIHEGTSEEGKGLVEAAQAMDHVGLEHRVVEVLTALRIVQVLNLLF